MRVEIELLGRIRTVEFTEMNREIVATIDGRMLKLSLASPERGAYLVRLDDGQVFEFAVQEEGEGLLSLLHGARRYDARILDPKHQRRASEISHEGQLTISSPMPGKVVNVLAQPGERVEAGASLVVVEAMKMQNELKAPRGGIIKTVAVAAGETVSAAQLLVVLD